jgi:ATP-dependent DNA helicase RecQ
LQRSRKPSISIDTPRVRALLRRRFGIEALRPGQREVIDNVLAGRDTLAVMPTGAGKSLCYQLPALLLPGTTLVVSPLISLMQDQVDKLDEAGVESAQVNSTLSEREEAETLRDIEAARQSVIFATPERLADPAFRDTLREAAIDLLVVDEAHCISQWGHDFRPAFLEIADAADALGHPAILALTATATQDVARDIATQLRRPRMKVIDIGIYRPNLAYAVVQVSRDDEKIERLVELLHTTAGSGIVYAATIANVERVHEALRAAGESVTRYHGRLPARVRAENQTAFMEGRARVMVATNAFGMGIDKPDIRFVVHFQFPGSLEAYYQESGRAGRDGEHAHCTLLFDAHDRRVQRFFLLRRYPSAADFNRIHEALQAETARANEGSETFTARQIADRLGGLPPAKAQVALQALRAAGLATRDRRGRYRAAPAQRDAPRVEEVAARFRERGTRDEEVLEHMIAYAQSARCRWRALLEYFGEADAPDHCGHCDNCLHPPEDALAPLPASRQPAPATRALAPGDAVRVPRYGSGRVERVDAGEISIRLDNGELRTFLAGYVRHADEDARRPA